MCEKLGPKGTPTMAIGNWQVSPEEKPAVDPMTAAIFPLIEPLIPAELDRHLAAQDRGGWPGNLTARRMFRLELLQACGANLSFQEILREVWQDLRTMRHVQGSMPTSGSLCEARARLPVWPFEMMFKHTATLARTHLASPEWSGQPILAIDGVYVSLPRSTANYGQFGVTASQHGESYYPKALLVLIGGALQGTILAERCGTAHEGDQRLGPVLLQEHLRRGDIWLGDAHFGHYPAAAISVQAGAFFLARVPANFQIQTRVVARHAPDDSDVRITPSSKILLNYGNLVLPEHLELRGVSFDVPAQDPLHGTERADFLTNLPRALFSCESLSRLGRLRWNEETMHNDLKTRLGLGDVRSQTPLGVRREILSHLAMVNAIRLAIREVHPTTPLRGSFTAGLSALRQANRELRLLPGQGDWILQVCAAMMREQPVAPRPNRSEPRLRRPDKRPYEIFKTARSDWRKKLKAG
jgi:hypothetical protein